MKIKTICNPINISCQYQKDFRSRETADPAVVLYGEDYFLFASHGTGYWVSGDLADWRFIEVDTVKYPDFDKYAPAPMVTGKRMYITHAQGAGVLYSDDPYDPDSWVSVGCPYPWNDPAFLYDGGRVYMYEGCAPNGPISVMELDRENGMRLITQPKEIFWADREKRGFERCGNMNEMNDRAPYLEGAWVNRIGDKYYLTYAVPGTEFATYADGCAISDSPTGPFEYCKNSPVAFKATGFMKGCGHGCLLYDKNGNLWKLGTVSVSVNHPFERRICIFPAKITKQGRLYVNAYRKDYPMLAPGEAVDHFKSGDAGWNLLSYKKKARASSVLDPDHGADKAFDENMSTMWSAATQGKGQWLEADLGREYDICSVQINFADVDVPAHVGGRDSGYTYKYILEAAGQQGERFVIADRSEGNNDLPNDYIQLDRVTRARYIRLTCCEDVPAGSKFAVSGLRVFGHGGEKAPKSPPRFTPVRCKDERNMTVTWEKREDAQGYFVRFGIDPEEMYTHFQVLEGCRADIGCLTKGVEYYVTVDAYNESGISYGTEIKRV